jgi:DNA-binding transcriptional LysR family regulator
MRKKPHLTIATHTHDKRPHMPLRFTLRQLEYFVAVGRAGSIAAAAEVVSVSSPSISAAITQLEAEFGVQLFVRHHAQGVSLTPGGRLIFVDAQRLLEQAGGLHDLAGDIADKPRGPLNIGCLVTLAPLMLAPLRRSFEAEYPEAAVAHWEADQPRLLAMLRRAEIDVAITYDLEIPQDVSFAPHADLPPYAILPADHPLASCAAIDLAQLEAEPLVLLDLPMSRDYFLSMFHAAGLRPRIAETTKDISVVHSLVANGFGYSLANMRPRALTAQDGGALIAVPLTGAHRPMSLGLATIRDMRKPRVLTAFEDHCRAVISAAAIPGMGPPLPQD